MLLTRHLNRLVILRHLKKKNLFRSFSTVSERESLWVHSPYPPVALVHDTTISEFLTESMGDWGNAIAFEDAITGESITHSQVYKNGKGFAAALMKMGLKRGDHVAIVLPNCIEFSSILLGIWNAGLVASPVNPAYTNDEIQRQLKSSNAVCAVTIPHFLNAVRETKAESPNLKHTVIIGEPHDGCHTYSEMVKTDYSSVVFMRGRDVNPVEELALLPYSSGTTGPPKGVMLTHNNMCVNLCQATQDGLMLGNKFTGGNEQERFLGLLPFFHSYGLCTLIILNLFWGAKTLVLPKFDPKTFLNAVRYHKPTTMHLVTPILNLMVNSADYTKKEFEAVHTIMGAAAPIGQMLINRMLEKTEKEVFFQEGYGMTELSPVSHVLHPKNGKTKTGSCGAAVSSTIVKVVDIGTGITLGPNESGEVCIKGPQVMKGYYNNEKATAETIKSDGWLYTGDIGYNDNDGHCYIVDRLKELIKVKGFQVAPSELEDLLRKHPSVSDVAVIGVPHQEYGEAPRAYLVKKKDSLDSNDINEYLKDKVTSFKYLRGGIEFVDAIPKAPSGKILRRVLSTAYKEKNGIST